MILSRASGTGTPAPRPFLVTPWRHGFLESLLQQALTETEGDVSKAVFLFPHSRPEKYLTRLLRHDNRVTRPLVLPRCHTGTELFADLRRRILARPAWNAGLLDRVGLLLACVREETGGSTLSHTDAAAYLTDARHFFPWGIRLAALFEECFSQRRTPEDFLHTEGQVSRFAALLLSRLSRIFTRYTRELDQRAWTTPGYDASLVAGFLAEHGELPDSGLPGNIPQEKIPEDGCLIIAGFHTLTGTEDALFQHLWKRGAVVMLHADPALVDGSPHWSCAALADWAARWHARLEHTPGHAPEYARVHGPGRATPSPARPRQIFRFYEGFDLHSQLAALERELAGAPCKPAREAAGNPEPEEPFAVAEESSDDPDLHAADTAVVLPDSGLLMPTLHHLPRADINISMGYPLARSSLFRLLDTLLRLQENRRGKGYYWRDLIELLRHPYIKMLRPEPPLTGTGPGANPAPGPGNVPSGTGANAPDRAGTGEDVPDSESSPGADAPLRRELRRLERALRESNRRYPEPQELLESAYLTLGPEEMPSRPVGQLLEKLLFVTLDGFTSPATPRDAGKALERLCSLLLTHGRHLWNRFLIDAECLYRLMQSLIPELCHSQLAEERFAPSTLFALVRQLMEAERVPFEATPLVGLQVMGMLETRLLSFRRVVIVDAGEDQLPGSPAGDPLLPEALRPELGLPALHGREQVAAYHFFRLLAGAEEVIISWQEGADTPGIQERKKKKSRFVEELLWEEEKRLGRRLAAKGQDGPLQVLSSTITPVPGTRTGITVTPAIRRLVREVLQRPVSASLLDSYLRCPARFFHERLLGLVEAEEVTEGDDPLAVGDLFHTTLQDFYTPHVGSALPGGEEFAGHLSDELLESFHGGSAFSSLAPRLPADSFAMLGCAGERRLAAYMAGQPPTRVLALETKLTAPFTWGSLDLTLTGKADRIDVRMREQTDEEAFSPDQTNEAKALEPAPGIVVVDYKTGRPPEVRAALWDDAGLWQRVRQWSPFSLTLPELEQDREKSTGNDLLRELARRMESVQLPLYLLIYSLARKSGTLPEALRPTAHLPAMNAVWVALGDDGGEKALFPQQFSQQRCREAIDRQIPHLIHFILRHMLESPCYPPHPGQYCDWCSSAKSCMKIGATHQ